MRETVHAALFIVVVSFTSFSDVRRGGGAGVVVGPRALVVFSSFAALIWAAVLTGVPVIFPGSLMTYEVVSLLDTSLTRWGIRPMVVDGRGAHTLRPARKTVCAAIRFVVAASCFLYALTWASYCRGLVGAGMDEVDGFLGEAVVLLP